MRRHTPDLQIRRENGDGGGLGRDGADLPRVVCHRVARDRERVQRVLSDRDTTQGGRRLAHIHVQGRHRFSGVFCGASGESVRCGESVLGRIPDARLFNVCHREWHSESRQGQYKDTRRVGQAVFAVFGRVDAGLGPLYVE